MREHSGTGAVSQKLSKFVIPAMLAEIFEGRYTEEVRSG